MRLTQWIPIVLAPVSGALAVLLAALPFSVDLQLHEGSFRVERQDRDPLLVTEQKWFSLPLPFGDFDIFAEVELGRDTELDLVFRRVEPRPLGERLQLFHGRFHLLRMSTRESGPPYRSRDEALFQGHRLRGGVKLDPGRRATVMLEARGRQVRASVAGIPCGVVETLDDHGSFAFLVRGERAQIHRLEIVHRSGATGAATMTAAPRLPAWTLLVGGGALLLVHLGVLLVGAASRRWLCALLLPPLAPLIVGPILAAAYLPLVPPSPVLFLAVGLGSLPLALAFAGRSRRQPWWGLPIGLLCGIVALELALRHDDPLLQAAEDPLLDAVFQPASVGAPLQALARRVPAPDEVHVPREAQHRVFYLGGKLLYEKGPPEDNLAVRATGQLRATVGGDLDGVPLATVDGHSYQQWLLYQLFYAAIYRPDVVVLGVPAGEAAEQPGGAVRDLVTARRDESGDLAIGGRRRPGGLRALLDPDLQPRSSPEELQRTVDAARAACEAAGARLLLLADEGLPAELLAVLRRSADERIPLVELPVGASPTAQAAKLASALTALFR